MLFRKMNPADGPNPALLQMLASMMNQRERERARVARILHDEMGQVLSAIGLQLDVIRLDFGEANPDIIPRTTEIQSLLERVMVQMRDLSYELNPSIVDRTGLQFALEQLIGRYRKSYSGNLRLLFDSSVHLPLEVANTFYKITEFAVENALRHAEATQIEVLVRPTLKGIVLETRDNGKGFDIEHTRQSAIGLGLLLMEYYAAQAGAKLSVKSSTKRGTIVWVSFSAPQSDESAAGSSL